MRLWIGLILMMFLAPGLRAAPLSEQQVTTAVETWLQQGLTENRPDAAVSRMEPHVVDGQTTAYIASIAGGGFCICGADDVLLPVYFYGPVEDFDPDNEELQGLLEDLASRLQWVVEGRRTGDNRLDPYQEKLRERAQEWQDLASGRAIRREPESRDVPAMMLLPLNSVWHQRSPFNQFCPTVPDGSQTIVGCVATAMAQIMYYWQWPETGYSAHSVDYEYRHTDNLLSTPLEVNPHITHSRWINRMSWTSTDGGQLQIQGSWDTSLYNKAAMEFGGAPGFIAALEYLYGQLTPGVSHHLANFAATSYNFALMEDAPTDPNSPAGEAAALLSYHAGISVDMNWGLMWSGTQTAYSAAAYENYFRYDPDTSFGSVDFDLIIDEIQWQRPIHIRGDGPEGGHSWVISGYDNGTPGETYFWMNLGWGAADIGWYRFDTIPGGIWFNHEQISGIAPASVVRFMGYPFADPSADGSPSNPYFDPDYSQLDMPDGGTLIIKTGYDVVWSGGGIMSKPMIVKGIGSTISYAP